MSIIKKTLLIIASIFFIITIGLFLLSRFFFLDEYLELEKEDASRKVEQSLNILDNKISSIKTTAIDYAAWDDTYDFVSKYNQNYVDSIFTDELFENLKLNFFALVDNNGKMVFISQYDLENHKLIVNNDTLEKALLNKEKLISGMQGLVKLNGIPTFIASTPVLKSDNAGPANGTLIVGQYLDENTNNLISNDLGFPVRLYDISDTNAAKEFNDIIQKFTPDKKTEIKYETGKKIQAYSLINDIDGKPLLLLQISLPRDIYNEGLKNINLFLIIIALTGILSCLVQLLLLRKIVLTRLINLSKETIKIGQTRDLSRNIYSKGNDELTKLTNSINKMLEDLRVNEHEIKKSEKRFKDLVEFLPEIVIEVNKEQKIVFVNKSFFDVTGYNREDFNNGLYVKDVIISSEIEKANKNILKVLKGEKTNGSEYTGIKKDGTIYPVLISSIPIIDEENGGLNGLRSILIDITDRKNLEEEITKLAYRDPLTNLPNRLLFNDRLNMAIADSERNAKKFALMVTDIDRFKDINDKYGHNIGDELLLFVGKRIEELLRKSDTTARFGGDEFLLLIPAINSKDDAIIVAEKILNTFKNKFILSGHKLNVTMSIGISIYPDDGKDSNTLFKNADIAMYQVKEQGRNNYKIYSANQ